MEVNGNDQILVHHGIDGQKWGKRKYQYEDGSLTPLGRIHYGVGEARDRSKIKMREERAKAKAEAKVVKAKAKAEIQKIRAAAKADAEMAKAKAEAYKAKKDADEQTERERIRADVEMDRNFGREQTRQMELQRQADKEMAKAQANAAVEQTKASEGKHTVLKALGITLAAVGIGYLAYKAVSGFSSGNTSEAGKKVASELGDKPASEVINKANKIEAKFNKSDAKTIAKELARQDKAVKAAIKADKIKETESYINKLQNAAKADETQKKVQAAKELVARSEMAKMTSSTVKSSGQSDFLKSILAKEAQKKASSVSNSSNWNRVETFFDKHGNELRKLFHGGFLMVGDKILIHSDELYHWGILGMKWGVRRYQNPDGTLTEEGRRHYGRKESKKFAKAKTYDERAKIANESKVVKNVIEKSGEYADLNERYKELKSLGDSLTSMQADEFRDQMHNTRDTLTEELKKYLGENASAFLMRTKAESEMVDKMWNLYDQSKIKEAKQANEFLQKEDLFSYQTAKKDEARRNEVAELGLKALKKLGNDDAYEEINGKIDKGDKDWFLYEDQTTGLPQVADLVRQGKTKDQIMNIIDKANTSYGAASAFKSTQSYIPGTGALAEAHGYRQSSIEEFIDACIEIKKVESKASTNSSQNSRSSSYTQLQNSHDELERKIKAEKDPLQKRFLQQELTRVTLKLNDELEKKNKQKHD